MNNEFYLLDINGNEIKEPRKFNLISTISDISENKQLALCIEDSTGTLIQFLTFSIAFKSLAEIKEFRKTDYYQNIINSITPHRLKELVTFLKI